MMGGGASGSSGTGTGSTANVYTPVAQPAADQMFQDTLRTIAQAGFGPAGTNYPTAQSFVDQYLTGSPYAGQAITGAANAANFGSQNLFPFQQQGGQALGTSGWQGLPYAQQALTQGFNPTYEQLVQYTQANPYLGTALGGASQAARIGGQGANALVNPAMQGLAGAGTMLNNAFDPQNALFNRGQQQSLDASGVANAMAGVGGSPYGASVTANALNNYGLNWQDRQLGRQQSGLGAYDSAVGAAGNTLTGAANLAGTSSALPSSTYIGQLGNVLNALKAQGAGGALGASTFSNILGGGGGALAQGSGLENTALQNYLAGQQQPYNTGVSFANNALSGLGGATNLGNQQYLLPQQTLNDLESYLHLGQSASGLSGQLGNLGFNQTAQGIGGALSGANALVGNNGLLTGSGGLGGLLGGGGAVGADNLVGAAALPGFDTLGGTVGMGALGGDFGGGAAAALPLAMSA